MTIKLKKLAPTPSIATSDVNPVPAEEISCSNCQACCCRLEVILISDTGVPERFITLDQWDGQVMLRLKDGFCAALDRQTYRCRIYENRPWVCREFATASAECITERDAYL